MKPFRLKPRYTKHFAERFAERCPMSVLSNIKKEINNRYCELIFQCLVYGNPQRISADGYHVVVIYDDVAKQLVVKTVY